MSWRVATRIARRDAWAHRGRSALVVAMIALPVLGLSAADLVLRTAALDGPERASRAIGAADLSVTRISVGPIHQIPWDSIAFNDDPGVAPADPTVPADALPGGSVIVPRQASSVTVATPDGRRSVSLLSTDWTSPVTTGLVRVEAGRLPAAPDEVALTPALADRLGVVPGGDITLADQPGPRTVVGLAVEPDYTGLDEVFAPLGGVDTGPDAYDAPALVDLPAGVDALDLVAGLNADGIGVQPRAWLIDPPQPANQQAQALTIGLATIIVGLAVLQVVLLAGAAFAVGARRQRRSLGLIAAMGGTGRDVGRTVLAGGGVLGLAGAAVGLGLGLLAAIPLRWRLEHYTGTLYGDWHLRPLELCGVAVIGLVTGLLAAAAPARTAARAEPMRALQDRPDPPRSGRRLTVVGLVTAAVGVAVTVLAASATTAGYTVILGGSVLVELGFVLCAPALVGAAGRLARPLPVPLRMALRDAARNRGRSGPAVAAVMAALAGCVAVSIYFVSQDTAARHDYTPYLRSGQISLSGSDPMDPTVGIAPSNLDAIRAALPGSTVVSWRPVSTPCADPCTTYSSWQQSDRGSGLVGNLDTAVGGSEVLRAALGRADPSAEAALAHGEVVFLQPGYVTGGTAGYGPADGYGVIAVAVTAPAVSVAGAQGYGYPLALVSAETAGRLGLVAAGSSPQYVVATAAMPTAAQLDRVTAIMDGVPSGYFQVETGYDSPAGPVLLVLLAVSAAVVLGATAISTGLAGAEGRADLATLAAVGAAPRTRRLLAMSQAAVVAVLGALLGAVAGFVPAAAIVSSYTDYPLVLPWALLGGVVVGVPALAAACAGVLTRSSLPMQRRTA